jgi:putative aminopeptidase FrvX
MKTIENLTREVMSCPTAPYREGWVLNYIKAELARLNVPYFCDSWGNVIAGCSTKNELKKSQKIALIAHTDHPGFHLQKKIKENLWLARWYGGCPPKIRKARVLIHFPDNPRVTVKGQIENAKLNKDKTFNVKILKPQKQVTNLHKNCFGAFDYPGFIKKGHRIHTRVADDLTGVIIILATFARLSKKERQSMIGIFTRAEETGFRGALGFLYSKILGPQNRAISLEASRQLEGARLGKGPVIRLGDRKSLFDSSITSELDVAAAKLKKNKFQRRIMNGGTCEATAFNFHGIKCGGVALPLGNYHNERVGGKPGPEIIDMRDLKAACLLCVEFYKNRAKNVDPVGQFINHLRVEFKKDQKLLKYNIQFKERSPNA